MKIRLVVFRGVTPCGHVVGRLYDTSYLSQQGWNLTFHERYVLQAYYMLLISVVAYSCLSHKFI
jgi:hypothetical protein